MASVVNKPATPSPEWPADCGGRDSIPYRAPPRGTAITTRRHHVLKNFYNVHTDELEQGDELVCTVKLMVGWHKDRKGHQPYRLYRCTWPDAPLGDEGTPQGSAVTTTAREI